MNKTTKHYFINLLKRKKKVLALYTFICFMGYPFIEIASLISYGGPEELYGLTQISFILALIALGILSAVLPIFTFKFSHTKKHVDTYFAVPINRNHLFKSHFIAPILGACIPILINYLIGGLILVIFNGSVMLFFELLLLLLLAFAIFVVIYSMNTFFVLNCNNVLDSCIITVAMAVLPLIFSSAVTWFVESQIVQTGMIEVYSISDVIIKLLSPYAGFILLGDGLECCYTVLSIKFSQIDWKYILYYIVLGAVFFYLSKKTFKNKKGENAEQLSTSFVTYPLLLNVGLFSFILLFNLAQMDDIITAILVIVMIFVAYVVANGIAQRSMNINMKMIIKFISMIVIVNGFNFISRQTEFFGINRNVINYTKYAEVEIMHYSYSDKYGEEENFGEFNYKIDIKNITETEKEFFNYLSELQKEKSLYFKENGNVWEEETIGSINIQYKPYLSSANSMDYKDAYFNLTDEQENKFIELYEKMREK